MSAPPLQSPLAFRCTSCGNCCRTLRVAVTTHDVARLVQSLGVAPEQLVTWLEPESVDMSGEPDGFVELSEGRRLMVLSQRSGGCVLLGEDNLCRTYAARPRDCRTFPFDFEGSSRTDARRLTLLPLHECEYAADGAHELAALQLEDELRHAELSFHRELVARWNRVAWHRRRMRKRVGNASDFLSFALERLPTAAPTEHR